MTAETIQHLWTQWLLPIIELLVGFGLVIFVHELGHFVVAKAVGIKVLRFSLGFGPKVLGVTRGETEYWLSALPLGGYVKMLGQEDLKVVDVQDPRSFSSKPIWARMAVVSAGVVMNMLMAVVLFIAVGLMGIDRPAAVVGAVLPGYPAAHAEITWDQPIAVEANAGGTASAPAIAATAVATATAPQTSAGVSRQTQGLLPGDRIIAIDGEPVSTFRDLMLHSSLATPEQTFRFDIERQRNGVTYSGTAQVAVQPHSVSRLLSFGIATPATPVFDVTDDYDVSSPAIQNNDRLVAINGRPVRQVWDIQPILDSLLGDPLELTVERGGKEVTLPVPLNLTGGAIQSEGQRYTGRVVRENDGEIVFAPAGTTATVTIPQARIETTEPLSMVGMIPRMRIAAIQKGSPAEKAGLRSGDIVMGYGSLNSPPTLAEFHRITEQAVNDGADIVVLRDGATMPATRVWPRSGKTRPTVGFISEADTEHPVVAAVWPDSPAARAGIRGGDTLLAVNGRKIANWLDVFRDLRDGLDKQVKVTVQRSGGQTEELSLGVVNRTAFDPKLYASAIHPAGAAVFKMMMVSIRNPNPMDAIIAGMAETRLMVVSTYVQIERLFRGTIPTDQVTGPLGIGKMGVEQARLGLAYFLDLMAIISVSLAVLNFLPIPVVDGGLATFLIIEKIRGKPLSAKIMNITQIIGLGLILALMVWALWNDILRVFQLKP